MSNPALSKQLTRMAKIVEKALDKELKSQHQELELDKKVIMSVLDREYKISQRYPKNHSEILKEMYAFIEGNLDAWPKVKLKKNKYGKTIYTTQGGRHNIKADRYQIFSDWKTQMGVLFMNRFKKYVGQWRDSNKAEGLDKDTGEYHKGGRIVSRALVTEHGTGHAYAAAAYRTVNAIFHGFNHPAMTQGGKSHVLGRLSLVPNLEQFNLELDAEKIFTQKGDMKVYYAVHLFLGDVDDNTRKSAFERKELGANGDVVKILQEIALFYESSPSTMKHLDKTLTNWILEKNVKDIKSKTKVSKTVKSKTKRKTARKPVALKRLRTATGQFTSAMNIQTILNAKIKEEVADNMGKGGALVYRTGRFAQSVSVEKVMQSRQGALTAFYTYMKAPYQTFERGYAQGSLRRDPRKLISHSIRNIAMETLSHKLHIKTRRV